MPEGTAELEAQGSSKSLKYLQAIDEFVQKDELGIPKPKTSGDFITIDFFDPDKNQESVSIARLVFNKGNGDLEFEDRLSLPAAEGRDKSINIKAEYTSHGYQNFTKLKSDEHRRFLKEALENINTLEKTEGAKVRVVGNDSAKTFVSKNGSWTALEK